VASPAVTRPVDAVTCLTVFLFLLLAIESRYVIGPLGGAGAPAQVVAVGAFGWWVCHQLQRPQAPPPTLQPVRFALIAFALALLVSDAFAMSRPIDGAESSTATLGMISLAGWMGVALLAHDGITDRRRFDQLIKRLVIGAALVGLLGVAQFFAQDSLIRGFTIPGLQTNLPLSDLSSRSGFVRPASTTLHPIEFGAVLTTILPLAIAMLRNSPSDRRMLPAISLVAIAMGIVVSGSRSALLCAMLALAILVATWSVRARLAVGAAVVALGGVVAITIPGMVGSLTGLFTGFGEDGSVQSRTDSYVLVGEIVERAPWFGRGFSTFLPSYRILDNQYLLLLIEVGFIGLAAFLVLLVVAVAVSWRVGRTATDPADRSIAQALAAGIAAAALGLGTYDGLSFPTSTGILFLVLGLAGAHRRLVHQSGLIGDPSALTRGPGPAPASLPDPADHDRKAPT
jgi:O-antigen ligase